MIAFDFIQKLHALVKKFPERYEEYKMLYPEAFRKVDITDAVKFKLSSSGAFNTFDLYDGNYRFAEMKPCIQTLMVVESRGCEAKEKKIRSLAFPVEAGYEVEFKGGGTYGFRLYRYGEKRDVVDLEFDPDSEKNRIKEKS